MSEIIACSTNDSFMILRSVGIDVFTDNSVEVVNEYIKNGIKEGAKIIIYDAFNEDFVQSILDKYEESLYPIFLKLPTGIKSEDTLLEIKKMIEKSIGISII